MRLVMHFLACTWLVHPGISLLARDWSIQVFPCLHVTGPATHFLACTWLVQLGISLLASDWSSQVFSCMQVTGPGRHFLACKWLVHRGIFSSKECRPHLKVFPNCIWKLVGAPCLSHGTGLELLVLQVYCVDLKSSVNWQHIKTSGKLSLTIAEFSKEIGNFIKDWIHGWRTYTRALISVLVICWHKRVVRSVLVIHWHKRALVSVLVICWH